MTEAKSTDDRACEVALTESLRRIPRDQRLVWTEEDGLKATHFVPVGLYAHKAADELDRLERERSEWAGVAAGRNRRIALIADEREQLRDLLSRVLSAGRLTGHVLADEIRAYLRREPDAEQPTGVASGKCARCGANIETGWVLCAWCAEHDEAKS